MRRHRRLLVYSRDEHEAVAIWGWPPAPGAAWLMDVSAEDKARREILQGVPKFGVADVPALCSARASTAHRWSVGDKDVDRSVDVRYLKPSIHSDTETTKVYD
jgi:hypothetical protein